MVLLFLFFLEVTRGAKILAIDSHTDLGKAFHAKGTTAAKL